MLTLEARTGLLHSDCGNIPRALPTPEIWHAGRGHARCPRICPRGLGSRSQRKYIGSQDSPVHRLRTDCHIGILGAMTTPEKIGRYEIKGELGRGGMATVYRAYDPSFEREVAIKVLPRELMHDPQFRDRFRREIKTIASLEHPAIVPVYDVGEEDGVPYFVMRYMTGGSLTQWIEKGKFSLEDAAAHHRKTVLGAWRTHTRTGLSIAT